MAVVRSILSDADKKRRGCQLLCTKASTTPTLTPWSTRAKTGEGKGCSAYVPSTAVSCRVGRRDGAYVRPPPATPAPPLPSRATRRSTAGAAVLACCCCCCCCCCWCWWWWWWFGGLKALVWSVEGWVRGIETGAGDRESWDRELSQDTHSRR
jgi:hypothetical protein